MKIFTNLAGFFIFFNPVRKVQDTSYLYCPAYLGFGFKNELPNHRLSLFDVKDYDSYVNKSFKNGSVINQPDL